MSNAHMLGFEISDSKLLRRRRSKVDHQKSLDPSNSITSTNQLHQVSCVRCKGYFQTNEQMINSNGEIYHEECFVCSQCFQKFPDGLYYEVKTHSTFINSKKLFF